MPKIDKELNKYTPYEKWSRHDYRLAYEEAEKLRTELLKERNELREKANERDQAVAQSHTWANHALVLGRMIDQLLKVKR